MKLLQKINRSYVRISALVLTGGAFLFFLSLRWIIRTEQDEELAATYHRIRTTMEQGAAPVQLPPLLTVTPRSTATEALTYRDTLLADPDDGEREPFRQLRGPAIINGKPYQITVRISLLESEDLLFAIGGSTLGIGLLLFVGLFWFNHRQARRLWRPFHENLEALQGFAPGQARPLELVDSDIDEFGDLTRTLRQLTEKTRADYRNLREFTENASHEIQTPLAVIRSKIEWLAQSENLDADQFATIQAIDHAAGRLSRLNQGLILLSKIENRQFPESAPVDLNPVIREQVALLEAITEAKNIRVALDLPEALPVSLHPVLAEVLVKNLLENAIRYSASGSTIRIVVHAHALMVANPGEQALEQPDRLFRRFARRGRDSQGLGLGLALVKKIADAHGLEMGYRFEDRNHIFWIIFSPDRP